MKKMSLSKIMAFVVLALGSIIWAAPIIWAFFTSFKSEVEIINHTSRLLPINWVLSNYTRALFSTSTPVFSWFINSVVISVSHTILVLGVVSTAAYGYTRLTFKGRDTVFFFLLATMMFPGVVNLIPLFAIVDRLGWINNPLAVIVPTAAGVFNIFLVRQFMFSIPKEFDESARIDGASDFQIFTKIILPLIRPILTVVALFAFTGSWNDFLWPSIVFNDIRNLPLTPGLQLLQGTFHQQIGALLAGALFAIIPTFLLYLFAQKYFLESLSLSSGVKG